MIKISSPFGNRSKVTRSERKMKEKFIDKIVKEQFPGSWVYVPREMYRSGIPDVMIVFGGNIYCYELKMQGNKLTPLQLENLRVLSANGAIAKVITQLKDGSFVYETYEEYVERVNISGELKKSL